MKRVYAMAKPKVPKPVTMSAAAVAKQKQTLNKLQNQLTRNARKNTKSINRLVETQQDAQEANVQQLSLLQQAAVAQVAPPAEDQNQLAYEASLRQRAETTANAQSDNITSASVNDMRDRQKADNFARFNLVKAALRNQQIY